MAKKAADAAKSKAAKATTDANKKVTAAKAQAKKVTPPVKAATHASSHKMIAGVNPQKKLTLYNGFLGFSETKDA